MELVCVAEGADVVSGSEVAKIGWYEGVLISENHVSPRFKRVGGAELGILVILGISTFSGWFSEVEAASKPSNLSAFVTMERISMGFPPFPEFPSLFAEKIPETGFRGTSAGCASAVCGV